MVVVKMKKKEVERCFTCPLCSNLFDRPTSISECLHIFCRNCIEDKFITEKLKACPICNVDLGVDPLLKLRADYSWEDMKLKLFPKKQESVKAGPEETVASSLKSSKKKERSLSSLLASLSTAPDITQDSTLLKPNVPIVEKPIITFRKRQRKTSKPERFELEPEQPAAPGFQFDLNTVPDCGLAEASTSQGYIQQKENNLEKDKEVAPLIVQPEPAIVTPNGRENQDYVLISGEEVIHNKSVVNSGGETEQVHVGVNQNIVLISSEKEKLKKNGKVIQDYTTSSSGKVSGEKLKRNGKGIQEYPTSSSGKISGKKPKRNGKGHQECLTPKSRKISAKKLKRNGKAIQECLTPKSGKISGEKLKEKNYSPPVLRPRVRVRAMSSEAGTSEVGISLVENKDVEGRKIPVWFTLVASPYQNTDYWPLPQIPVVCLSVPNRNMSVLHVKKYIKAKLSLESDDEVEIWLRHEPVCSSLTMDSLVDWWVQTTPLEERKSAMVGDSAAKFVMVLYYNLKVTTELSDSE